MQLAHANFTGRVQKTKYLQYAHADRRRHPSLSARGFFEKESRAVTHHRPGVVLIDMQPNELSRHKYPGTIALPASVSGMDESATNQRRQGSRRHSGFPGNTGIHPKNVMNDTALASDMASNQTQQTDELIGTAPSNATTFAVRPGELDIAAADAPERVDVDLRLPIEVSIRTPTRQWHFEFDGPGDTVAYVGVTRSTLLKNREPQCVPGWMSAVMAYVGFEIADSGVKR